MKNQKYICAENKLSVTNKKIATEKSTSGITLIALVITIIVLLILAGVSISALTGEDGIFSRTEKSKETHEQAEVLENLKLVAFEKDMTLELKDTKYIDYLKSKNIVTDDSGYYVVDVNKVSQNAELGKGNFSEGDVYYILEGDVYYKSKDAESILLGTIFKETETEAEKYGIKWLYEENEAGNMTITGIDFGDRTITSDIYRNYITLEGIETLTFPSKIDGKTVTEISLKSYIIAGTTYTDESLKVTGIGKIVLPDTVEVLGSSKMWFEGTDLPKLPANLVTYEDFAYGMNMDELWIPTPITDATSFWGINVTKIYLHSGVTVMFHKEYQGDEWVGCILNFYEGVNPEIDLTQGTWGAEEVIISGKPYTE